MSGESSAGKVRLRVSNLLKSKFLGFGIIWLSAPNLGLSWLDLLELSCNLRMLLQKINNRGIVLILMIHSHALLILKMYLEFTEDFHCAITFSLFSW